MGEGFTNNGTIVASCPKCGSNGYVPSGSFKSNKDILLALIREIEYSDIRNIQAEVSRYIEIGKAPNAVKKDLKKKYPKYKKVWDSAPEEAKDLILFLGWLLGVLGSLIAIWSQVSNMSDDEINTNIINPSINFYFQHEESQSDKQEHEQKPTPKKYET